MLEALLKSLFGQFLRYLVELINNHRIRLVRPREVKRIAASSESISQAIKGHDSIRLALADAGLPYKEALAQEVPGAMYVENAELQAGDNLRNAVINRIRREGPKQAPKVESPHEPGRSLASLGWELDRKNERGTKRPQNRENADLEAFVASAHLQQLVAAAPQKPTTQELESFIALRYLDLSSKDAAERLGRPAEQVRQEDLRARSKLRQAATGL
jgi:hypothetical protein